MCPVEHVRTDDSDSVLRAAGCVAPLTLPCRAVPGVDTRSEPCQRFFRDGLTTSFTKILTDDAVSGWKFEIHVSSAGTTLGVSARPKHPDLNPDT